MNIITKTVQDCIHYRPIIQSLVTKDLVGRYKNSTFGFLWHFFTPLLMMAVYYVVFTTIRPNSLSYFWVFMTCGLFPFNFMMSSIVGSPTYITSNVGLVKKMYIPRELIILSRVISNSIIMVFGYCIILLLIVISGFPVSVYIIGVLPLFILVIVFALGCSLLLSAINVYHRDVQHFISSVSMALFFITPMYFTVDSVSGPLATIIWVNPLTYFVESFHQLVYFGAVPNIHIIGGVVTISLITLLIGLVVFFKLEKRFAEKM